MNITNNLSTKTASATPVTGGKSNRIELHAVKSLLEARKMPVTILDVWGEARTSSNENPYTMMCCDYVIGNLTTIKSYNAPLFTASGRMLAKDISPGNSYLVEVKQSDRGYDEWISVAPVTSEANTTSGIPTSQSDFSQNRSGIAVNRTRDQTSYGPFDDF